MSIFISKAVKAKALSTVNCLLQKGANTDLQDFSEVTALHQAAKIKEAAAIVQSLLEHGAKIDAKEQYNITPVFTAAQQGNLENLSVMIDFLKKHGNLILISSEKVNINCYEYQVVTHNIRTHGKNLLFHV